MQTSSRRRSARLVSGTNYLDDVNANGVISGSDVNIVKAATGHVVP